MKCRRCGTELRRDDEFCYHCGERTTLLQRMVSSRMFAGSVVAIVLVAVITVVAYFILTDRLVLPFLDNGNNPVTSAVEDPDGTDKPEPAGTEVAAQPTSTPEPTATPFVFEPGDVTDEKKSEFKPLLERTRPFLAFAASFYADGSHAFHWNDVSATVLSLYRLQNVDKKVKYGDSFESIKKKVKKEMTNVFGDNYKFDLTYGGTFPDYVYVRSGNTVVYNARAIGNQSYSMKTENVIEYKEGRFRVIASACLVDKATKRKGASQRYTLFLTADDDSRGGYVITKIRLYKKGDKKAT